MSETQTVLQSTKQESAENIAEGESRRSSQVNQSPIKNILSRVNSFTQRSQKSNRNSINEENNGNANNTVSAVGPVNSAISNILNNVFDPTTQTAAEQNDVNDNKAQQQQQYGKIPVKVHVTQQSPIRSVKTQQIVLDDGHTISVRIEGKYTSNLL
jgi:hypothetical protein